MLSQVIDLIEKHERFGITSHIRPDGDTAFNIQRFQYPFYEQLRDHLTSAEAVDVRNTVERHFRGADFHPIDPWISAALDTRSQIEQV